VAKITVDYEFDKGLFTLTACLPPGTPVFEAWQQALHALFITLCHKAELDKEDRDLLLDYLDRAIQAYGVEEYTEC
jgi:hypothetical protein